MTHDLKNDGSLGKENNCELRYTEEQNDDDRLF